MGWFDDQIRERKQSDQELFEYSILHMASAVVGSANADRLTSERIVTKQAIDDILKYYRFNPVEIPASLEDPEEQLEYVLRPHGIMHRMVNLEEGWYKDAFGPLIAYRKDDNMPIPLFPKRFKGYWYRDPSGKKVPITAQSARMFDAQARCFYSPLPLGKLGARDLINHMRQCLNFVDYAFLTVLSLLVTLTGLQIPALTKILTGFVYKNGSFDVLWATAAFLLCTVFVQQLISTSREVMVNRIMIKVSIPIESAFMMRILSLPATFFRDYNSGELAKRNASANKLCSLLVSNVLSLGITTLFSLLYIVQIAQFTPALVWPSIGVIVVTVTLMYITSLMQMRVTKRQMEFDVKENGKSFAMISAIQKIKLTGSEKRAFAQWVDSYTKSAELQYNPPLFLKISPAIITGVSLAGAIILYYLAVVSGVNPSEYIAFYAAYGVVMGAFTSLASVVQSFAQLIPLFEMVDPILKTEPEVSEEKEILTNLQGRIELNNVYFRYSEKAPYVVNGMNLLIRPGEYVAIVGKSGCGKSTLVRLLLGFEKPEKGAIYYDSKDMAKLDLRSLRRRIGTVMQDDNLFKEDIYSNITISAPGLSVDEAWEAAEIASIADDIRAMPMGMATMVSEGQGGFSGGQKQRLIIARAIASKPRVLIFDEATSALDNRTQKMIAQSLDELKCTRIVIAHRLSTIKNCDRILYIEDGRIVEDGTYDELIEKNGLFAELVERQRLDLGAS